MCERLKDPYLGLINLPGKDREWRGWVVRRVQRALGGNGITAADVKLTG
jgi:hypothetical protein